MIQPFKVCYHCLAVYNILTAPKTKTKGLKQKEPACPTCGSKLYFS
ncbi:hypothetical protein fHeYen902_280 [Yersinia phage fHe-Yen9-02]|nr:hypothetical protein fHeYen902_280 [Yersinia phage fHe-Yen9-02]